MVERVINRASISYRLRESFTRSFPQPLTHMTMRDRFDSLLVEHAVSAGAVLRDGFKVVRVEMEDGVARIHGEGDVIEGSVLVGADGANSVVAHQLDMLRDAEVGVGLEREVYADPRRLAPWDSTVGLDMGTIRGGYMWLFPKEDHLSIGVAGFEKFGPRLIPS